MGDSPSLKGNLGIRRFSHEKSKGPLWPRFIKRFYGINGELDEYREQEVNRIGNKLFILLFLFEFISTALTFLLSTVWKVSAEIFLYCNAFVIIFVMPMVMVTMLTNRDLQGPIEVPRDKLEKERQKAKKKGSLCTDPKKLDNKLLKGFSSVLHRTKSF